MLLAIDSDDHFIQMPFVAKGRPSCPNASGGLLSKLQCPAAHRFVGHFNPSRCEHFLNDAVYHVTSRGDRREAIAKDNMDRRAFLAILGQALERFNAKVFAYCLMGNHYHLVIQTCEANLSRLMRQINGVYTQTFNRRHVLSGHLFQGRFKAIIVDSESYLLEVCRYVDLNPVRANMCKRPDAYPWSSYGALAGLSQAPGWLNAQAVYAQLMPRQRHHSGGRQIG